MVRPNRRYPVSLPELQNPWEQRGNQLARYSTSHADAFRFGMAAAKRAVRMPEIPAAAVRR